jgi:enamine deaminase RidA (YjgF/YER057c/UK114 family)
MARKNISSNTVWENIVGYSRAVRVGNVIEVSGTAAVDGEKVIGVGDAYTQTQFILKKISNALKDAGSSMKDIVRTRIFLTDILTSEAVANAHNEVFKEIKPATSLIVVKSLIHPDMLVEIEATAIVEDL